jgi:hypothetical protein
VQDDESDDEAELKAELERIRAERAAEAEKRAAEEEAKRQEAIRAEVLGGNPLMAAGDVDFGVKRRCVRCSGGWGWGGTAGGWHMWDFGVDRRCVLRSRGVKKGVTELCKQRRSD